MQHFQALKSNKNVYIRNISNICNNKIATLSAWQQICLHLPSAFNLFSIYIFASLFYVAVIYSPCRPQLSRVCSISMNKSLHNRAAIAIAIISASFRRIVSLPFKLFFVFISNPSCY